jgi:hypothetical protein
MDENHIFPILLFMKPFLAPSCFWMIPHFWARLKKKVFGENHEP